MHRRDGQPLLPREVAGKDARNQPGTGGIGGSGGAFVPPANSFIVKWGPTMVPAGTESTQCVVKRLGNTKPVSIHEIHNALGATSHHFIVYRVNDTAERPEPYGCAPFTDTLNDPPLIITQRSDDRLILPEGVAYTIEPNQMIRLELHYINVSAAPQTVTYNDAPFTVPDGGGFKVTCDWNNRSNESVGFGTSVNDEMCFL